MAINPFRNSDICLKTMGYLSPRDICHVGGVCRSWRASLNLVIHELHKAYDLPRVEGGEFNIRNFGVLATMGFSQKQVRALYSKYIGEPIGPSPSVTKAQIEELCKPDPDQPRKRKFETHRGVILFPAVKRTFGKGEAAVLDQWEQLTITKTEEDSQEKELIIPLSIFNVAELFNHPKGKENGSVFTCYTKEYTPCIKTTSVVFVRCEVPEDSRNKVQEVQKNRLPGTPVSSLIPLMISCGFDILETGTCAFASSHLHRDTYACTSDVTFARGDFSFFTLGMFLPGKGVVLGTSNGAQLNSTGAIPMIPPEGCPYSGSMWDYLVYLAKYAYAYC
jgi:hypothetical protein